MDYQPKLPLNYGNEAGVEMISSILQNVRQNIIMLLLTCPGEKTMMKNYGVGLSNFLFEQDASTTRSLIIERINEQFRKYLPYVNLTECSITNSNKNENYLAIKMRFYIETLSKITEIIVDGNEVI